MINFLKHPAFAVLWFSLAVLSYYFFDLNISLYQHFTLTNHYPQLINIFSKITLLGSGVPYIIGSGILFLWGFFQKNKIPRADARGIFSVRFRSARNKFAPATTGEKSHSPPLDSPIAQRHGLTPVVCGYKILTWIGFYLLIAVIISGLTCDVLKIICGRARPQLFFSNQQYGFYFWQFHSRFHSFPSGHSTTIAALGTACSLMWPRTRWFFLLIITVVAISRVIVGAHYLSDVMIGVYLGFLVTYWLYERFNICRKT